MWVHHDLACVLPASCLPPSSSFTPRHTLALTPLTRHSRAQVGHEYAEGWGAASWLHAVNDAVVGHRYPFPRAGPHQSTGLLPVAAPRFRTVIHQVCVRAREREPVPLSQADQQLLAPFLISFAKLAVR